MKVILVIFLGILFYQDVNSAMSPAQIKAAVKMVRNMCQPKTKATNEAIDGMHTGNWDIDHNAMCYMNCALNTYKLMNKDNTLNYEGGLAQLKQLPDDLREDSRVCVEQCKDSVKTTSDKCVAAYEISKCMYECNPEKYFLP